MWCDVMCCCCTTSTEKCLVHSLSVQSFGLRFFITSMKVECACASGCAFSLYIFECICVCIPIPSCCMFCEKLVLRELLKSYASLNLYIHYKHLVALFALSVPTFSSFAPLIAFLIPFFRSHSFPIPFILFISFALSLSPSFDRFHGSHFVSIRMHARREKRDVTENLCEFLPYSEYIKQFPY